MNNSADSEDRASHHNAQEETPLRGGGEVAAEKKANLPRTRAKNDGGLRERVVAALLKDGCVMESHRQIRSWLLDKGLSNPEAKKLAHRIAQWTKSEPKIASIAEIARLLKTDLESFLGRPRAADGVADGCYRPGQGWFSKLMAESKEIRCYITSVTKNEFDEMQAEGAKFGPASEEEKVKLARNWAGRFRVVEASNKLAEEHGLFNLGTDVRMQRLLEARMEWIRQVPKWGPVLVDFAKRQAYLSIYEGIANNTRKRLNRFPCMLPDDQGRPTLDSMRVASDRISMANEPSYIIYYFRGPALTQEALDELLRQVQETTHSER